MAALGFRELVPEAQAGHIITCFHYPAHANFSFEAFYTALSHRDQVIYPGKVTEAACFRIGNIGDLHPADMHNLLKHIAEVLAELAVPVPVT
jgi:2-aminoethylphosphonate-pyruvate transaminase